MSTAITGVVEAVSTNQRSKNGKDFYVYGVKVGEEWYNTGFDKPAVERGDNIKLVYTENNFGKQTKVSDIEVIEASKGVTQPATPQRAYGGNNVQDSIIYQSSRKDAVSLLQLAQTADALPKLPTKKSEQLDALVAMVDVLAVKFALDAANPTFRDEGIEVVATEVDDE